MNETKNQTESYSTYYDLEITKLIKQINKEKKKLILLQFPDGLKYYSKEIIDILEKETNAEFITYFGTCFGACEVPIHLENLGFDLCVQWGHSVYIKNKEMW